jgi:hypothetical protein
VERVMTDTAEHEGLAAACRHDAHPDGLVLLAMRVEIRELAHVMDLNLLRRATEFTSVSEESTNQLIAFRRTRDHEGLVDQDGLLRTLLTPQAAQYRRIAARRGKKRALIAVGHRVLVMIYHILTKRTPTTRRRTRS